MMCTFHDCEPAVLVSPPHQPSRPSSSQDSHPPFPSRTQGNHPPTFTTARVWWHLWDIELIFIHWPHWPLCINIKQLLNPQIIKKRGWLVNTLYCFGSFSWWSLFQSLNNFSVFLSTFLLPVNCIQIFFNIIHCHPLEYTAGQVKFPVSLWSSSTSYLWDFWSVKPFSQNTHSDSHHIFMHSAVSVPLLGTYFIRSFMNVLH